VEWICHRPLFRLRPSIAAYPLAFSAWGATPSSSHYSFLPPPSPFLHQLKNQRWALGDTLGEVYSGHSSPLQHRRANGEGKAARCHCARQRVHGRGGQVHLVPSKYHSTMLTVQEKVRVVARRAQKAQHPLRAARVPRPLRCAQGCMAAVFTGRAEM